MTIQSVKVGVLRTEASQTRSQKWNLVAFTCEQVGGEAKGNEVLLEDWKHDLKVEEANIMKEYNSAAQDEEKFLFQQAKIEWLSDGDRTPNSFILFSKKEPIETELILYVMKKKLQMPIEDANMMIMPIKEMEIKQALFDICDNNPSPDEYTAKFYKEAWSTIGKDVCDAVIEFFNKGKMLGEVNATLITLVPKISTPLKVSDFRPIACCNVLYKIISKIITNRIKTSLCKIKNPNLSAFIPGRQITDNILTTQELLRGYEWKNGAKRVAMKIDIQKAYDKTPRGFFQLDFLESQSIKVDLSVIAFLKMQMPIEDANMMIMPIKEMEIKQALFDICDNNPSPDEYTAKFYKEAWSIIGKDIISKIITNRIKTSLCKIKNPNLSAFIPGRQITDNILTTQELLRGYEWKNRAKRVAMKIDIQKAYDTVNWDFLESSLSMFGFPQKLNGL
ncbi:RNA-directed DNA polymerase, eukaryota, reverse transcriptase zinc-binding domain protein [Tanacetum coccineum]